MLRLRQTDDRLPRHHKRGRLSLLVRGAPLRLRIRHRARRSRLCRRLCCLGLEAAGREQGRNRARQGRVGGQGGAEKKDQGERKGRWEG